ncbi:uncharacterized protein BO87DRAFT_453034 [Aspergillus neoniger CBS 115656]|uniref:Uncharacterized protein n=1 Tax=Aspergillus neoniger (strain CBS 115656) TaxID=1448310 RepID=A0A318Y1M3_ASPNB|nr:hypothetical protein BO87DRAFT_453034 [Aspergillus neoniger CBS 115656]PYH28271.1 hypothetical protein BO87DRAFT_453034 [Aspergillus neoniger CBS 115656]
MPTQRIGIARFLYKIKAQESDRCSCRERSPCPQARSAGMLPLCKPTQLGV